MGQSVAANDDLKQGIVFKKLLGQYEVHTATGIIMCSISSVLRKDLVHPTSAPWSGGLRRVQAVKNIRSVDPVAIGDYVGYVEAGDGTGVIRAVYSRTNKLARQAAGNKDLEQVIVANVDQIVPILAAAQPTPRWGLLDRYLAAAEAAEIPTLICITKIDLLRRQKLQKLQEIVDIYESIGYTVILTSAETGLGVDTFQTHIQNRTSVLVGMSGVGKSSLLNAVQPDLGLRVKTISDSTGKGRHTTTHLEMFPLNFGGNIVDTPGIKTLGLWEIEDEDLATLFVEMEPYVGQCKFRLDCTHVHEPNCAIKAATETGDISQFRYDSYVRLLTELRPRHK
ncbi:MAG: ribosome small subunit-dependent GTPase A [Chloroflexota bacterium]